MLGVEFMGSEREWSHIDQQGRLRMVDVSEKEVTDREAHAEAVVHLEKKTLEQILGGAMPKGNVLEAARLAGIMAAKKTSDLIPLCHPLALTSVDIDFSTDPARSEIRVTSKVKTRESTGVEMEALVAVTQAALTIYDMCKAVDRAMVIDGVRLIFKAGGRSGTYRAA